MGIKHMTGVILAGILGIGSVLNPGIVCAEEKSNKRITLRMSHYWGDTDADVSSRYLKEILEKEFPEAFPEVELIQETCDNETYKKRIKVQIASDEAPDLMFCYGAGFMKNFVEAGKLLPLDDYLDDFYKEQMLMDQQENFIFDDQMYGVCCSSWKGVLYCNTELFEKAGAELPETLEELTKACDKLRQAEIEPVALGMMNRWPGQMWINDFVIQLGGAELYKAMARGEAEMDNEILSQAAALTEELIQKDAFCTDLYSMMSGEAEKMFLNGDAAMIYIGSWFTTLAEESLGDKLDVVKMPAVQGAAFPDDYYGGGINGWAVSADTEYPELAADIAAWLSYRLSCYQPENAAFDIVEGDAHREVSPTGKKIMELYEGRAEGGAAWDTLLEPEQAEIWLEACAQFFDNQISSEEFGKQLQNKLEALSGS